MSSCKQAFQYFRHNV